jgi:hypothetical protein
MKLESQITSNHSSLIDNQSKRRSTPVENVRQITSFYAKQTQFYAFFARKRRFHEKTKPIQTQLKPKQSQFNPIQSQFNPKQTQFKANQTQFKPISEAKNAGVYPRCELTCFSVGGVDRNLNNDINNAARGFYHP